jgi:hypothetical protein
MGWREQLENLICAIFLLASILVIAIRSLFAVADPEFKIKMIGQRDSNIQSEVNTTIRSKQIVAGQKSHVSEGATTAY